jgi:Holliday junction DNA helicase RuvB
MSVASMVAWRLANAGGHGSSSGISVHVEVKRGPDAIFGDGPYPRTLDKFIGQPLAKEQLASAMLSAAKRGAPMEHTLLASGYPGIGKTALAKIVAATLKVGYVEVGGTVTVKDIRPVLHVMQDHDVLFIDEIHRLVSQGKRNAEWLLQLLQDGVLALPTGVERAPRITVIGATTDAQKLPETILGRFPIQPILEPYNAGEAFAICLQTAERLETNVTREQAIRVSEAANYNPRAMDRILRAVRNIQVAGLETDDIVARALVWTGLSSDGLTAMAQDYLMLMYGYGGTAGQATMKAALNEIAIDMTEKLLIQKGFIVVTPRGRELTKLGVSRAQALLDSNHPEGEGVQ